MIIVDAVNLCVESIEVINDNQVDRDMELCLGEDYPTSYDFYIKNGESCKKDFVMKLDGLTFHNK